MDLTQNAQSTSHKAYSEENKELELVLDSISYGKAKVYKKLTF